MFSAVMPAFGDPLINMFLITFVNTGERTESKILVFWKRLMCGGRVSKDGGMLVLLVLKVIVNAFLFHEPANEIEIRLPILHAVFPRRVITGKLEFEIAETTPAEDVAQNVL